jgi:hypothetical protein
MPAFPTVYIKHKGLFDQQKLIQRLQGWYGEYKYDFQMPKYKAKPDEFEVEAEGSRKINEYVKFTLKVVVKAWEVKEVEVVKDGETRKMNQGRLAIEVNPEYELDYGKRFGGNKFLQALQDFYHNYIMKRTIEEVWEGELWMHQNAMIRAIREVLGQEVM